VQTEKIQCGTMKRHSIWKIEIVNMMPPVAATIDEDFKEDFHKKKRIFYRKNSIEKPLPAI
jgi:hypothetical protein